MDKHILGIIMLLLGIGGLSYTGISLINDGAVARSLKTIIFFIIIGAIFFFAGISLI